MEPDWQLVAWWSLAWSILAYAAMAFDKRRARAGRRRVRERSLLTLGFVGGSPGILLAMYTLRHKNRKASFLARFFLLVVLQGALLLILRLA